MLSEIKREKDWRQMECTLEELKAAFWNRAQIIMNQFGDLSQMNIEDHLANTIYKEENIQYLCQ